jgi:hypothetical protein
MRTYFFGLQSGAEYFSGDFETEPNVITIVGILWTRPLWNGSAE